MRARCRGRCRGCDPDDEAVVERVVRERTPRRESSALELEQLADLRALAARSAGETVSR